MSSSFNIAMSKLKQKEKEICIVVIGNLTIFVNYIIYSKITLAVSK